MENGCVGGGGNGLGLCLFGKERMRACLLLSSGCAEGAWTEMPIGHEGHGRMLCMRAVESFES